MELKLLLFRLTRNCSNRSNRTFMELKSMSGSFFFFLPMGSNRTFMELKSTGISPVLCSGASSNRTFMELKCGRNYDGKSTRLF